MRESKNTAECKPPSLRDLGLDLLHVSAWRRALVIATPFFCFATYFAAAQFDCWPLMIVALIGLSFSTYGSTSHELVHRNLRLPRFINEGLLCLIELLAWRSGHAYRAAHVHHHATFPLEDDLEGSGVRRSFLGVLLSGMTMQVRVWFWALKRDKMDRWWILVEGILVLALIGISILTAPSAPWLSIYAGLMLLGHSVLPLFTVWLVHNADGQTPLFQTRAFRGRLASIVGLQHLYHLEHHLYPRVPHPNWPELARRIEPFLVAAGVPLHRLGAVNRASPAADSPSAHSSRRTSPVPAALSR